MSLLPPPAWISPSLPQCSRNQSPESLHRQSIAALAPPSRTIRPPRAAAARASEKFAERYAPINLERDHDLGDFAGSDSETLTMEKIRKSLDAKSQGYSSGSDSDEYIDEPEPEASRMRAACGASDRTISMRVGAGGTGSFKGKDKIRSRDDTRNNHHAEGRTAGNVPAETMKRKKRRHDPEAVEEGGPMKKPRGNPRVFPTSGTATDVSRGTHREHLPTAVRGTKTKVEGFAQGRRLQSCSACTGLV